MLTSGKPITRGEQMSRIKNRHTAPEVVLRKALWHQGFRYRLHAQTPVGRPDVVFPSRRLAVFIDGCFWHGCPVHYVRPRTRTQFWADKLRENVTRDCRQTRALIAAGWQVVRVWEHEVFTETDQVVARIAAALHGHAGPPAPAPRVFRVIALEADDWERRYVMDLYDSAFLQTVEGKRFTTKWKRQAR